MEEQRIADSRRLRYAEEADREHRGGVEDADVARGGRDGDAEPDEGEHRPGRDEGQAEVHREKHRPRGECGGKPDDGGPRDQRHRMGRRADAVEAMDERLEDLDRSPLERGPATREPRDEPSAAIRCHDEPDQDRDAYEVDRQHDERGHLEKPRHRDDENQHREDEHDDQAVQDPLDDERGERRPEGMGARCRALVGRLPAPGDHIDTHDLARAEREHVVGHVADHVRRDQSRRLGARREQIPPPDGPRPQPQRRHRHRRHDPPPPRHRQLPPQFPQVDAPQEIDEQRNADPNTNDDPKVLQKSTAQR